jgi:hypothetical protein
MQWVPGALSPELKRLGREADPSLQENVDLYIHSPIRLHGVVLIVVEHRDNFTVTANAATIAINTCLYRRL